VCFRGEGSTAPAPEGVEVRGFTTNESLARGIRELHRAPDVIFYVCMNVECSYL